MGSGGTGIHLLIIAFGYLQRVARQKGLSRKLSPLKYPQRSAWRLSFHGMTGYCLFLPSLDSTKYLRTVSMKGSAPAGGFTLPESVSFQLTFEP